MLLWLVEVGVLCICEYEYAVWLECGDVAEFEACLCPDALKEFCRLISGRATSMLGRPLACTLWSRGAATPETEVAVVLKFSRMDLAERVERLDEDRCRRAEVGIMVVPVPVLFR